MLRYWVPTRLTNPAYSAIPFLSTAPMKWPLPLSACKLKPNSWRALWIGMTRIIAKKKCFKNYLDFCKVHKRGFGPFASKVAGGGTETGAAWRPMMLDFGDIGGD
jgi:hypothetical protein